MRLSPGATFDRYAIEAWLGEGGMGEVYRAADPRLHRKVALKILRGGDGDNETWTHAVARMQREARAAAALNHPNTVAIYDVGEHDGIPFIAMELIDGESLRASVGRDLPFSKRVSILCDVARVLAAAHREGLVHRDIKPENVMLRHDGVVKVLDFGIARRMQLSIDAMASTVDGAHFSVAGPGALVGTPAYMAPEQLRGEDVDARADQFAWGVLAYELMSGRLPFGLDKGAVSLIASILSAPVPPLDGVPDGVQAVIVRALSKDPRDRYPSMDELLLDLSDFISGDASLPVPSHRTVRTAPQSAPTTGSPRWARFVVGAAVVLAVASGFVVWVARRNALPSDRQPPVSAAPNTAPTVITDLPMPQSDNRAALLAYREGIQALRDGAWEVARAAFQRSREADPSLALAHLRYSLATMPFDPDDARKAFQRTILLRASLTERDQALLDALEPYMQRDPPDRPETAKRLEALARRFPGDAELAYWRVEVAMNATDELGPVLPLADACLALDPKYADCWQAKGQAFQGLGQLQEAVTTFERCTETSFAAVDCLWSTVELDLSMGRCDRLEDTARRWIAASPSSGRAYHRLAVALRALGRPDDAVRAAIEKASSHWHTTGELLTARIVEIDLAVALGDFASVEQRLKGLDLSVGNPAAVHWQPDAPLYPSLYYQEIGRAQEAGRTAAEFLARREGLTRPDVLPWRERTLDLRSIAMHAGLVPRAEYEVERAAWLRRYDGAAPAARLEAWYTVYARPAQTAEDAREALAALPALAPLPHNVPSRWAILAHRLLGKVYYLAGDMNAALPHLTAASGCHALIFPFAYMHNLLRLGAAREALGEKDGACAAYQAVVDRWGASGLSVTAKEAAKRARALGCPAKPKEPAISR